ncbi:hypothetical protein [Aureimonas mangrovi]|uniref:hypothetical protein n=1 Tax=Aureimonas mangrovi TaxID=2758041 RepID=UPI00163DBAAF|nr:hypothetical protein [Aureimonas mangrovi]
MSRLESYRSLFDRAGRRVTIERQVTNGQPMRVENVRARVRGVTPEEVVGGIDANARKVLILAEDIPAEWRPLKMNDDVIVDGVRLTFTQRPDDQTHRDGETLLAYDCLAAGA